MELIDLVRLLWRQKWIIAATVVAAVITAWLVSAVPEPTYRAAADLLLMPSLASELNAEDLGAGLPSEIYERMATSTSVLQEVRDSLDESTSWTLERMRSGFLAVATSWEEEKGTAAQVILLEFVITGPAPQANLERMSQAWIDAFRSVYESVFEDRASRSYDYILENLQLTESEIARVTSERMRLLEDHPRGVLEAQLGSLSVRMERALSELQSVDLEFQSLSSYGGSSVWPPSGEFRSDVVVLSEVSPYTLTGAVILGLTNDEFSTLLAARRGVLESEITKLEEDLAFLQYEIDTVDAALSSLDQELTLLQETSGFLSSELQDTKLALAETQDPIRVINAPMVSRTPSVPKKRTNMAIAGILGLLFGTLLASFIDYLRRVRIREEQERSQQEAKEHSTPLDRDAKRMPDAIHRSDSFEQES